MEIRKGRREGQILNIIIKHGSHLEEKKKHFLQLFLTCVVYSESETGNQCNL